jgi:hypothetical protein
MLKIDPELKALITPLTKAERADLRKQLIEAGRALDPILTWRGTVIDGHNRYEICTELDLPYDTKSLDLPDRAAVKRWMFDHQISRRNLTTDQIVMLAAVVGVDTDRGRPVRRKQATELFVAGKHAEVLSGAKTILAAYQQLHPPKPRPPVTATRPPTPIDPVDRARAKASDDRLRREHADLVKEVAELREAKEIFSALSSGPLTPIKRRELSSGMREGTAVALASDWHVEETVRRSDTPVGNEYNLEISDKRVGRFFSGLEWLIEAEKQKFKIRDLILWLGGDLMTGHIHEENVETGSLTPLETVLWLQPRLLAGVRQVADKCQLENIQLVCSYGNHGRDTRKSRRATGAAHSYEWMLYQQIAKALSDDKRFSVLADPSGHQYTSAYGLDLHFHHGDELSYGGGIGGIMIPVNKAVSQWNKSRRCDLHHFGHFHQYIDSGDVVMNGSLIGFNAYAMSIKASPEPPQQAFYVLDSKRGKTAKSPIWVDGK